MRNLARHAVRRLWQLAQKENRADSIQNKVRGTEQGVELLNPFLISIDSHTLSPDDVAFASP